MAIPYDSDRSQASPNPHSGTGSRLQDEARQAKEHLTHKGEAQFAHYRDSAADEVDKVARSADAAADAMQDQDDPAGLSHYVADIANNLGQFAESLRGKSAEDMLHEANRLARENPALFITGSVALGFGLTRFMRASTSHGSTGSSLGKNDAPQAGFDEEPEVDTDASFAPPKRPFDDLDSPSRPLSGPSKRTELPQFNPASQAERDAKGVPSTAYGADKNRDGGMHS
ncbi:hypothetical protein [Pseudomonas matsuisoli]|uniref:Uncharacterized protein n=1 Tax=Pseudomonas matsuisoli TaxID=1515666 RepID=A0A917PU50_9PSED|nr:hypothetical protein [Pseudomonas matsuisoli]GGJ92041.1 hypothetical protein GCM10009304_17290 [Pseudomonas matsuisoli]